MAVGTDLDFPMHSEPLTPLMARARAGDEEALCDLVSRSYDRVFPVCRRVVGNDADAADAAREALVSTLRSIGEPQEDERYVTCLYRSAVRAAVAHTRRRARRAAPGSNDVSLIACESDLDSMVESIDLDLALLEVPPDLRVAVVLRDLCGLGYPQMGEVLEAPVHTVVERVASGRARLVELLGSRLAPDADPAVDGPSNRE